MVGHESHLLLDIGSLSRGERKSCLQRMCLREGDAVKGWWGTVLIVDLCPGLNNRGNSAREEGRVEAELL